YLDQALREVVDPAAVVAGKAADDDAQREAERDPDQADGQRNAGAIDQTRQHVAAKLIGTEEMNGPLLRRAEQVEAGIDQTPEQILVTEAEEPQGLRLARVDRVFALERRLVQFEVIGIDERTDERAGRVEQMQRLRWRIDMRRVLRLIVVGCQDLG